MKKELLKYLGVFFVIIGVIILSVVVFNQSTTNTSLTLSLIFIIIGFFGHILLNKYIE